MVVNTNGVEILLNITN